MSFLHHLPRALVGDLGSDEISELRNWRNRVQGLCLFLVHTGETGYLIVSVSGYMSLCVKLTSARITPFSASNSCGIGDLLSSCSARPTVED